MVRDDAWQSDEDSSELDRWFDGELEAERAAELADRIESDSDAREAIEFYQRIRDEMRARPRPSAPVGFAARIARAVRDEESPSVILLPFVRGMAVAASIFLVVSVGFGLFSRPGSDRDAGHRILTAGLPRSAVERVLLGEAGFLDASVGGAVAGEAEESRR